MVNNEYLKLREKQQAEFDALGLTAEEINGSETLQNGLRLAHKYIMQSSED